ncbi:hypothetical protein B0T16DRAFT_504222 [Cercophora newfieldiana]|uniref:glycogenin glucosyltransferase n=1 Tax=Cercophora newfieldiana TaxID=92897 RepID=A0AA39YG28_9PEZI|nr:hypothetical protein B0T16DRAFT_504222 [Cercophora newfieldiana]
MNRPDLHSAFTKINLWRQTQFRKIVYLDADVVAYRAPDELFDLPYAFSAAPDIGWPDLFNTGVMVLTPNMGDYYAMMAMADRGISFDGADQGLLNMHFKNTYNRLSFTYNVTPSAHYQYVPAYKHFQSSINLVHFIGSEKPWLQGRDKSKGDSPFDEIAGRWWAVYDRHYRVHAPPSQPKQPAVVATPAPELVQYFVKGEYQPPRVRYVVPVGGSPRSEPSAFHGQLHQPLQTLARHYHDQHHNDHHHHHAQHHDQYHDQHGDQHHVQHEIHHHHEQPQPQPGSPSQQPEHAPSLPSVSFPSQEGAHTEARAEQAPDHQQEAPQPAPAAPEPKSEPYQPPPVQSWDAQRQPPPSDSKPEAMNFPQTHYEMSSDPTPFVPPERYPSPPKGMWYEVPKERPAPPREKPRAIFPWESHQPKPSRIFPRHEEPESPVSETPAPSFGELTASSEWQPQAEPSMTGSPTVEPKSEPQTPPTPTVRALPPSDPWSSFPRTNAWDEVPEINRYIDAFQKHHRTRSQGLGRTPPELGLKESTLGRRGSRVTDFPSEVDRPSLPVTPAPVRRPRFWGGGGPGLGLEDADDDERLPAAEGVPAQSDWVCVHGYTWTPADCPCDLTNVLRYHKDPMAQLQKLAKQQSELLLQKLGGSGALGGDIIGTEGREIPSRPLPFGSEDIKSPTYVKYSPPEVVSPRPMKPDSGTSPVQNILDAAFDITPQPNPAASSSGFERPSYQGPGVAFEKGEDYPTQETPMPPTEEERDALEA